LIGPELCGEAASVRANPVVKPVPVGVKSNDCPAPDGTVTLSTRITPLTLIGRTSGSQRHLAGVPGVVPRRNPMADVTGSPSPSSVTGQIRSFEPVVPFAQAAQASTVTVVAPPAGHTRVRVSSGTLTTLVVELMSPHWSGVASMFATPGSPTTRLKCRHELPVRAPVPSGAVSSGLIHKPKSYRSEALFRICALVTA
jgi:hypothetical protein